MLIEGCHFTGFHFIYLFISRHVLMICCYIYHNIHSARIVIISQTIHKRTANLSFLIYYCKEWQCVIKNNCDMEMTYRHINIYLSKSQETHRDQTQNKPKEILSGSMLMFKHNLRHNDIFTTNLV